MIMVVWIKMYEYKAKITNVVDGDTYDFVIDLGFGITYKDRLRLYGVDTPEKRGLERAEGLAVTEQVKKLILDKEVTLRTHKWKGKYGRFVAEVFVVLGQQVGEDVIMNLGDHLVKNSMAVRVDY